MSALGGHHGSGHGEEGEGIAARGPSAADDTEGFQPLGDDDAGMGQIAVNENAGEGVPPQAGDPIAGLPAVLAQDWQLGTPVGTPVGSVGAPAGQPDTPNALQVGLNPSGGDGVSSALSNLGGGSDSAAHRMPEDPTAPPAQLTRQDVEETMATSQDSLAACASDAEQRFAVDFVIQPSGRAEGVEINGDGSAQECVRGVVEQLAFPAFAGEATPVRGFPLTVALRCDTPACD